MIFDVDELTDFQYDADLVDTSGLAIPFASLTSFALTLKNVNTLAVINSRSAQNVLNLNGVTINSAGHIVWNGAALDNPIVNVALPYEMHLAMFRWVTVGATPRTGTHEVFLRVRNLQLLSV